ncbi:hypothetical protein BDU57DRAFT_557989 [Ampelomyces quisqualis]|uniref:Uncharacterized protein n=1 Tax=Ampelomyces quisqualis TaxID=50730 RepID=A0A6A5QFL9_AMPQU|nr:hypothetical protein BDU57DRAFT_557989 [Ampelomyces quisqualis]
MPSVALSDTSGANITDDWNATPGARGCTPQAFSLRDQLAELHELGAEKVFGVSTQNSLHQAEAQAPLHLSDEALRFPKALKLPTFEWQDRKLLEGLAFAVEDTNIIHPTVPLLSPDPAAKEVVKWLAPRK